MSRLPLAPAVVLLAAAATVLVTAADGASPLRTVIVLAFVALGPGLALVPLIDIGEAWSELTLALAVSLALDVLIAGALVYAGVWSSATALAILVAVSVLGAAAQLRRGRFPPTTSTR